MRPCYRPNHNKNTTARVNSGPMFRYYVARTSTAPWYVDRKHVVEQIKRHIWIRRTKNAPGEERQLAAVNYVDRVIMATPTGFRQMDLVAQLIATNNAAKDVLFRVWLEEAYGALHGEL